MLSRPIQRSDKRSQNTIKVVAGQPDISSKARLRARGNLSGYNLGSNLLEWHELQTMNTSYQDIGDFFLVHYEFVITRLIEHRPASNSLLTSLWSLCHIHNETKIARSVNIYSHLFGSILFATLPFSLYRQIAPRYATATIADIVVFSTFFFGVAICFLLSATFHLLANHSKRVNALGNQLDYLGVVILMWGSTIPTVYYGFYCDPAIQETYWTMISLSAAACAVTTLHPKFRHSAFRPYRAIMYSCLGLSSITFVIHGLILYGYETQNWRMSLDWMGIMAGFNLFGAFAYAARIPEKWFPRRHDILGSSHQILHFMVIFAGLAHMAGLLRAFDHIHSDTFRCI
ncbi:putative hemolysin-iii channel protein [Botrytis fragariae]|uniref:Putative hemolysin-iii channel protein n=1 Tax=Botrytis fragariae TaxID=1964551 RepID=A0A8H6B4P7_9HELO|nr:putative hemolysin-iii channel protein [Botrytis fragariae]KAF5879103.1 putative hemolysin-iii channel protein [Botrytis fragariae]